MIEILNLLFLIFIILWISQFPINRSNLFKPIFQNFNAVELITFNISIILTTLLIISFFKFNLNYILWVLVALPLLNFIKKPYQIHLENISLLAFSTFVIIVYVASNLKLEWDGQLWIFKTINFYNENNFKNLSNVPGFVTYPHLGTFLWAFFWKNSFIDHEYTGRIFYVFSYCLSLILIISQKKLELIYKILLLIIFFIFSIDYYLLGGYQEYLIFSYLIFIFYFYQKYLIYSKKVYLIPLVLFINSALWIKNESVLFIIFFLGYILCHHIIEKKKIKKEILYIFILSFILIFLKYFIFYSYFNTINTGWHGYKISSLKTLFSFTYFFERSYFIFLNIFVSLIKCKIYIILFLSIIFLSTKNNFKLLLPYMVFFILNIILIFLIYYCTNNIDWKIYLATTVDRLLIQTSGIYLIIIYELITLNFFKNDKITN